MAERLVELDIDRRDRDVLGVEEVGIADKIDASVTELDNNNVGLVISKVEALVPFSVDACGGLEAVEDILSGDVDS